MKIIALIFAYVVLVLGIFAALTLRHDSEKEIVRLKMELRAFKAQAEHCTRMEAYCKEHAPFTQLTYWCEEPKAGGGL